MAGHYAAQDSDHRPSGGAVHQQRGWRGHVALARIQLIRRRPRVYGAARRAARHHPQQGGARRLHRAGRGRRGLACRRRRQTPPHPNHQRGRYRHLRRRGTRPDLHHQVGHTGRVLRQAASLPHCGERPGIHSDPDRADAHRRDGSRDRRSPESRQGRPRLHRRVGNHHGRQRNVYPHPRAGGGTKNQCRRLRAHAAHQQQCVGRAHRAQPGEGHHRRRETGRDCRHRGRFLRHLRRRGKSKRRQARYRHESRR